TPLARTAVHLNARGLLVGDVHLGIAAWRGRVHSGGNEVQVQSNKRPLRSTEHNDGYSSAYKILLIAHIFVSRKNHVEPGPLPFGQQVAVSQHIPSSCLGGRNSVAGQEPRDAARRYVIKKNEHPQGGWQRGLRPEADQGCGPQIQVPR